MRNPFLFWNLLVRQKGVVMKMPLFHGGVTEGLFPVPRRVKSLVTSEQLFWVAFLRVEGSGFNVPFYFLFSSCEGVNIACVWGKGEVWKGAKRERLLNCYPSSRVGPSQSLQFLCNCGSEDKHTASEGRPFCLPQALMPSPQDGWLFLRCVPPVRWGGWNHGAGESLCWFWLNLLVAQHIF